MRKTLFIIAAIFAAAICLAAVAHYFYGGDDIPPDVLAAMRNAEGYKLFSLEPKDEELAKAARENATEKTSFHKWPILGSVEIADSDTREELTSALRRGANRNHGVVAGCFWPRHGLRITHAGRTFDILICFECLQAQVYEGKQPIAGFLVTASPQPVFDEVLRMANVQLPRPG
jgi:hypothetical protein